MFLEIDRAFRIATTRSRWFEAMIDISQASYLYLLTHPELKSHKVGIGTDGQDKGRMQRYIDQGWVSHGIWRHSDKRKTFQWEREIFAQLQLRFERDGKSKSGFVGKSDKHWFEGISADAISVPDLAVLISKVAGRAP